MEKVTIRKTDDFTTIKGLHLLTFPSDSMISNDRNTGLWVGKDETGTPVCFCTARNLPGQSSAFLERAGVLPSASGFGLQRRMINIRLAWAKSLGLECAITYTVYDNHASIVNLLRCGMKFYTPYHAWAGKDVHYFRKDL